MNISELFLRFGDPESFTDRNLQQEIFNQIQKCICEIFNISGILDVNAARLQLFLNNYTFNYKKLKN